MSRVTGKRKKKVEARESFHVEVFTKARFVLGSPIPTNEKQDPKSHWQYYVKWAGYDSNDNTWEPYLNVGSCQRLLASFWKHIGTEVLNYNCFPSGYEVSAKIGWIEMEQTVFATEYQNDLAEKKHRREEARPKKKAKKSSREPSASESSTSKERKPVMSEDEFSELSAEEGPSKQSSNKYPSPEIQQSFKIRIPPASSLNMKIAVLSSSYDEGSLFEVPKPQNTAKEKTADARNNEVIEISSSSSPGSPNSLFSGPDTPTSEPTLAKNPEQMSTVEESVPPNKPGHRGTIMKPKEIIPPKPLQPLPLPVINIRLALSDLSFKNGTHPQETFSMSELATNPSLPRNIPNEPPLSSLNFPVAQVPTSSTFIPNSSFSSPVLRFVQRSASLPELTISPSMIFKSSPTEQAADAILQNFIQESLALPVNDDAVKKPAELLPPKTVDLRTLLPRRVKREWKWTGPLFLNSQTALCNIRIHNLTQEATLRFSTVFQNKDRIEVSSLYDIADIRRIISAFRKPSQMGQLSPSKDTDAQALGILSSYMNKMRKAFLIPIIVDDNVIGQVLCVPYSFYRHFFLEDPSDVYQSYPPGRLVVIIIPYTLSRLQLQLYNSQKKPSVLPRTVQYTADDDQWRCSMQINPQYHRALKMLNFPRDLLEYVGDSVYPHPYAIWTGRETGNVLQKAAEGMETRLLERILNHVNAKKASSISSEFMVLFVHAGALRTIIQLPEFVERRAKYKFIRFYLYGSDPDISPNLWSVTEIWPRGGIVTFTPSVMQLSNPAEVYDMINQISRHPIWACYILPSALGMLANMECGSEDPLKAFDERKLSMNLILKAIEDGNVALIEALPQHPTVKFDDDIFELWSKYIAITPPTKREALEMGVKAFKALQDSSNAMEHEITANMSRIQRQPVFMNEYRRYVVVCSKNDGTKVNTHSDGLEWTTAAEFDFMDEHFLAK